MVQGAEILANRLKAALQVQPDKLPGFITLMPPLPEGVIEIIQKQLQDLARVEPPSARSSTVSCNE